MRPSLNGPKSTAHEYLSFPLLLCPSDEDYPEGSVGLTALLNKELVVIPGNAVARYTVPMPNDSRIPGRNAEEVAAERLGSVHRQEWWPSPCRCSATQVTTALTHKGAR